MRQGEIRVEALAAERGSAGEQAGAHLEDAALHHEVDAVLGHAAHGGLAHGAVEGLEDHLARVQQHLAHKRDELGEVAAEVLVDEVEELRAHLHADGAAADDDEGEHLANALLGDAREAGGLELLHDASAELDGVGEVLEKEAVLLHAGSVEGVGLHADAEDEVVVGHLEGLLALDLGFAEDGFAVEIHTGGLCVAEIHIGVHLPDRVCDRSIFDCADCR